MNRILVSVVVILILVAGLAYYAGWWTVTTETADQKTHIGLTVDKEKFQADEKKAVDGLRDLGQAAKDKVARPTAAAKE